MSSVIGEVRRGMGDSSGNQTVLPVPWERCCGRSPTSETVTRGDSRARCQTSSVGAQTGLHGAHNITAASAKT